MLLAFIFGSIVLLVILAIFAPWGFFLGGHFHILPVWQGWGTMNAKSGKYVVYVSFMPSQSGSRVVVSSGLRGNGYVCTPRGEISRLTLGGGMRRSLSLNTDGEKISLDGGYQPLFFANLRSVPGAGIRFRGHWQNPNIVVDQEATITIAFSPDGTIYHGQGPKPPVIQENVPFTLVPGSYSDFEGACKARN